MSASGNFAPCLAEEAWMDRTVLIVSPETYAAFLVLIDRPPQPNDRLRRTILTPPPWH
ncbi:MAG: DUF1778 domain-containing protein [Rhodospirillales bacterium]|nr:DUF1778 domain-containing protein [Rhodospirillales bacterium]